MAINIIEPLNRLHLPSGSKITALHAADGILYVGLANGDLSIMSVSSQVEPARSEPRSIKSFRSFHEIKRLFPENEVSHILLLEKTFPNVTENSTAVSTLDSLPLHSDSSRKVLLVGSAETLRVYEWVGAHLSPMFTFENIRNYTAHAYIGSLGDKDWALDVFSDSSSSRARNKGKFLLIANKKKLVVHEIVHKSRNIVDFAAVKEIGFKERIKTLEALPDKRIIQVALNNTLLYLDVQRDFKACELQTESSGAFSPAQSAKFTYFGLANGGPDAKFASSGSRSLVLRDADLAVLDYTGKTPTLNDCNIKLIAAPSNVAILNPCYALVVNSKSVQVFDIESGSLIQSFNYQLSTSGTLLVKDDALITIAGGNNIYQFKYVPYRKQLDQFLSMRAGGNEANLTEDSPKLFGIKRALTLVKALNENDDFFDESSETLMSRAKVKQLYLRDLYKEKAIILFKGQKYHELLISVASEWLLSFSDIIALFPDFLDGLNRTQQSENTNSQRSARSSIKRVTAEELEKAREQVKTSLSKNPADQQKSLTSKSLPQNIREFDNAVQSLIVYLTDQRRIHMNLLGSKEQDPTVLWKGIELGVSDIYPELGVANEKEFISEMATAIDTTLFLCYFYVKPTLMGPLLRLPNNKCDARVVNQCILGKLHENSRELISYMDQLLDFYYGKSLHEDALKMLQDFSQNTNSEKHLHQVSFLKGPNLTIKYLQKLPNKYLDLILKYAHGVLTEFAEDRFENATLIFMSESYECEGYDSMKVFEFLAGDLHDDVLAIAYLEWVLFDSEILESPGNNANSRKLATKLSVLYLNQLKALDKCGEAFFEDPNYRKLYRLLESNQSFEPWTILRSIPLGEDKFLRLTIFIYYRLGEHMKSVDVLYNQLSDLTGAMAYCVKVYYQRDGRKIGEALFNKLLEDLLMHYKENQDDISTLLAQQGSRMSILHTIASLPADFPISKLVRFIEGTLVTKTEDLFDSRIKQQLHSICSVNIKHDLLMVQAQSVTLRSGFEKCASCGQQLGGGGAMCVSLENQIVHFTCLNR